MRLAYTAVAAMAALCAGSDAIPNTDVSLMDRIMDVHGNEVNSPRLLRNADEQDESALVDNGEERNGPNPAEVAEKVETVVEGVVQKRGFMEKVARQATSMAERVHHLNNGIVKLFEALWKLPFNNPISKTIIGWIKKIKVGDTTYGKLFDEFRKERINKEVAKIKEKADAKALKKVEEETKALEKDTIKANAEAGHVVPVAPANAVVPEKVVLTEAQALERIVDEAEMKAAERVAAETEAKAVANGLNRVDGEVGAVANAGGRVEEPVIPLLSSASTIKNDGHVGVSGTAGERADPKL